MVKELLPPENIIKMLKKRLSQLKYTLANKKRHRLKRHHLDIYALHKYQRNLNIITAQKKTQKKASSFRVLKKNSPISLHNIIFHTAMNIP